MPLYSSHWMAQHTCTHTIGPRCRLLVQSFLPSRWQVVDTQNQRQTCRYCRLPPTNFFLLAAPASDHVDSCWRRVNSKNCLNFVQAYARCLSFSLPFCSLDLALSFVAWGDGDCTESSWAHVRYMESKKKNSLYAECICQLLDSFRVVFSSSFLLYSNPTPKLWDTYAMHERLNSVSVQRSALAQFGTNCGLCSAKIERENSTRIHT